MKLLILCLAVAASATAGSLHKKHPCDDLDCKAGRECVVVENQAQCLCMISCPDHFKPVCGTDGSSFDNHCKLHQHACLTGHHISIQHKGYCKKSFDKKWKKDKKKALINKFDLEEELQNDLIESLRKDEKKQKQKDSKNGPAVCYGPQRNALRFLLVEHWTEALKDQPWHLEGMTYRESLWGWFFKCDSDKDNFLTPDELLNCSKDVAFFARPGQDNELTKALCVDALVDDGDRNRDWRLDFEEFTRVMDPKYEPKEKKCSLEGKNYLDGEEVYVDCNHCICAVGNWVCASTDCVETKPKAKTRKSLGHANEIDNAIDAVGTPTSENKEKGVLDSEAALDIWTENNKKDKKKAKEMQAEDFDVKDNMFLDFDLDNAEEKKEKSSKGGDEMNLDDYYDDLLEKSKIKDSKKRKLQLEKALKEVKLLKKKTELLQQILSKNQENNFDEEPLPVAAKKNFKSTKKFGYSKKNIEQHKSADSKSKGYYEDTIEKTDWNDLIDWGKHKKNSKNSNHHSKKENSANLF